MDRQASQLSQEKESSQNNIRKQSGRNSLSNNNISGSNIRLGYVFINL